jgi:hypothetical protein
MCVDFRNLNKRTKPISFPIPRVDEILTIASGSRYFSVLDSAQAYHQKKLTNKAKDYCSFEANGQKYTYQTMPFGWPLLTPCGEGKKLNLIDVILLQLD